MKSAGDNLIMDAVPEIVAVRSRKVAQALALRGFAIKKGKKLMIRVRCNLIMPAATVGGCVPRIDTFNF
jgi:hypothetical protein